MTLTGKLVNWFFGGLLLLLPVTILVVFIYGYGYSALPSWFLGVITPSLLRCGLYVIRYAPV